MNAVVYHSNTGQCLAIARYAGLLTGYPVLDVLGLPQFQFENLVLVFPVHCQNIPGILLPVFEKLNAKNVVLLAAYGRMSYGNVLRKCQMRFDWKIIAGAYVPTSHCYLPGDPPFTRWDKLDFIVEAFRDPVEIRIPASFKNPLADVFPQLRSRLGVRILRNNKCTHCGLCQTVCDHKTCVRCLKCVHRCPSQALSIRRNLFMTLYLKTPPKDDLVIYRQHPS